VAAHSRLKQTMAQATNAKAENRPESAPPPGHEPDAAGALAGALAKWSVAAHSECGAPSW
jgi:hypothetical protein